MTPLHWAVRAGAMECARILLKHGSPANALNKAHRAPLPFCVDRAFVAYSGADFHEGGLIGSICWPEAHPTERLPW